MFSNFLINFFVIISLLQVKFVCATISPIFDRFFYTIRFGHYDIHPDYETDTPRHYLERPHAYDLDHYYKFNIPYGMPAGFYTNRGRDGKAVGLLSYLLKHKSASDLWRHYYSVHENTLLSEPDAELEQGVESD